MMSMIMTTRMAPSTTLPSGFLLASNIAAHQCNLNSFQSLQVSRSNGEFPANARCTLIEARNTCTCMAGCLPYDIGSACCMPMQLQKVCSCAPVEPKKAHAWKDMADKEARDAPCTGNKAGSPYVFFAVSARTYVGRIAIGSKNNPGGIPTVDR